jgi:glycyl-tRNA synthetase
VLRLDHRIAPVKAAVLPLSRNADLSPKARDLAAQLRKRWNVDFDDASAIGRRYRRPGRDRHPVLRHRGLRDAERPGGDRPGARLDGQDRVGIDALEAYLSERLTGC